MQPTINHPGTFRGKQPVPGRERSWRRFFVIVAAASLPFLASCSSAPEIPEPEQVVPTPFRLVADHERYLVPGEELEYAVSVLIVKVGVLRYRTRLVDDGVDRLLAIDSISAPTGIAAALSRYGGRSTSWIDRSRVRMKRYVFSATTTDPPKRRYNELLPEEGRMAGTEVWGSSWTHASHDAAWALDPASLQFLVRVIDLEEDETVRLDMFEGHNRRLATISGRGREQLKIGGEEVPARVFALRVDKVAEGELYEEKPEMDVRVWVSEDDRRVILRSRGSMGGVGATIRLVRRTVAPAVEVDPTPADAAPAS